MSTAEYDNITELEVQEPERFARTTEKQFPC